MINFNILKIKIDVNLLRIEPRALNSSLYIFKGNIFLIIAYFNRILEENFCLKSQLVVFTLIQALCMMIADGLNKL